MLSGLDLLEGKQPQPEVPITHEEGGLGFTYSPTSAPYRSLIDAAEAQHGLPKNLLPRLIQQESNFDPKALSPKGAKGIAQIIPSQHPTVKNPHDPAEAIPYSASYLKQLYNKFGSWPKAIAAYNTGPGNVDAGVIPQSTIDYTKKIYGQSPIDEGSFKTGMDLLATPETPVAPVQQAKTTPQQKIYQAPTPPGGYDELGRPLNAQKVPYPMTSPFTGQAQSNVAALTPYMAMGSVADLYQGKRNNPLISPTNPKGEAISNAPMSNEKMTASQPQSWWQWMKAWVQGPENTTKDKATNVIGLQRQTGMSARDILKHYDEHVNDVVATNHTNSMYKMGKDLIGASMTGLIGIGIATHPAATIIGLGTFIGIDELKSLGVQWLQGKDPKFREGATVADLLEAQGFSRDAIEAMEFIGTAVAATGASKFGRGIIGKSIAKSTDKVAALNDLFARAKAKGEDPTITATRDLKTELVKDDLAQTGTKVQQVKGTLAADIERAQAKVKEMEYNRTALEAGEAQLKLNKELVNKNIADQKAADKAAKAAPQVTEPTPTGPKTGVDLIKEEVAPTPEPASVEPKVQPTAEPPVSDLTEENIVKYLKDNGYGEEDAISIAKSDLASKETGMLTHDVEGERKPVTNMAEYDKQFKEFEAEGTEDIPKRDEPYTEVDEQTGEPIPEGLLDESSPFRNTDSKATAAMSKAFAEKMNAVRQSPEMLTQYFLNEFNRHLNGEEVDFAKARDSLSELASRADEARGAFDTDAEFTMWKETVQEAAAWARRTDRSKIESTPEPGIRLNLGIPLDEIPRAVRQVVERIKGIPIRAVLGSELFRNKAIWKETGFWLGKDGRWRYEIDDSNIKIELPTTINEPGSHGPFTLRSILRGVSADKLFQAVPELDKVLVRQSDPGLKSAGQYDSASRIIWTKNLSDKETLLHETQHAVNEITGGQHPFLGSSPMKESMRLSYERMVSALEEMKKVAKTDEVKKLIDDKIDMFRRASQLDNPNMAAMDYFMKDMLPKFKQSEADLWNKVYNSIISDKIEDPFVRYMKNPGEMEARLSEARMNMTAEERSKVPPWETLDRMLEGEAAVATLSRRSSIRYGKDYPNAGQKLYSGIPLDKLNEVIQKLRVWHGSNKELKTLHPLETAPFRTGEGGMARGAGLYVSEEMGVGESYANKTGEVPHLLFKGKDAEAREILPTMSRTAEDRTFVYDELNSLYNAFKNDSVDTVFDSMKADLKRDVSRSVNNNSLTREEAQQAFKEIDSLKQSDFSQSQGGRALHELEIPENAKWLDWDKPVLQGSMSRDEYITIRKKINDLRFEVDGVKRLPVEDTLTSDPSNSMTGGELYKLLDEWFAKSKDTAAGDIEASKFLRDLGYAGNRFRGVSGKESYNNYVLFAPEKFAKVVGTKLYSGMPLDEIARTVLKKGREFSDAMRKDEESRRMSFADVAKDFKKLGVRGIVERSGNIRQAFIDILGDQGYKIVETMYLQAGAHPKAVNMLRQMKKEVYGGAKKDVRTITNDLTMAMRMIDLGKYKTPKQFTFPEGKTPEESLIYKELFAHKETNGFRDLTEKEAADVQRRADAYFEWMRKPVADALEEGLITQKEHDDLISHNYRRIRAVEDVFDRTTEVKLGGRKTTVNDSGIQRIQKGRATDVYEASSEIMALEQFNRLYGRIYRNKANRELLSLARADNENPFARVKFKKEELVGRANDLRVRLESEGKSPEAVATAVNNMLENKIPSDFTVNSVKVYENGKPINLFLSPDMAQEWITSNAQLTYKYASFIRWVTGAPIVRTFATGINWAFALKNLPRDIMQIWFTARTFRDGKYESVYSPTIPIAATQMTSDMLRVFRDAVLKKGKYNDYIDDGGGMDLLTTQGRMFRKGKHLDSGVDKFFDFAGYPGNTSEIMTRLMTRNRVIINEAKRRGISYEEAAKDKDIRRMATFAARDYMDFHQGGDISKALDTGFPYLNAKLQASRGMERAMFKDQPVVTMYKLAQFGALVTGLYIGNQHLHPQTMEALQGDQRTQGNLVFPLGDKFSFEDSKGQTRYPFLVLPIDQSMAFFKTVFEAGTDVWLGNPIDIDRITTSLKNSSPVDLTPMPPIQSGAFGYLYNKNFWQNKDIRKQGEIFNWQMPKLLTGKELGGSEEEYTPGKTPQALIDTGKVTGLSPERLKYLAGQLVTNDNIFGEILGKGYESAFGQLPKKEREMVLAETLAKVPIVRSFFKITNPYSRYAQTIAKSEEASEVKRFTENRGLDTRAEGYLFDHNYDKSDVVAYMKSFNDLDTYDRLKKRFDFHVKTQNLDNRSFWLRLEGLGTEARARAYVEEFDNASPSHLADLMSQQSKIHAIGGFFTDDFRKEVQKVRRGQ